MVEENDDNQIRSSYGPRWQRLPSASLNMDIKNRIKSYQGNLKAALTTDVTIENNLKTLEP